MNDALSWLQHVHLDVTTIIAFLGLGLSLLSLYLQRHDKQPRLKIRHKTAMLVGALPRRDAPRTQFLVANPGERTITVTAVHLLLKDGRRMPITGDWMIDTEGDIGPVNLPCKLTTGESISLLADLRRLAKSLRSMAFYPTAKFKIEVTDATDRKYTKRSKIDTKEWAD